jgi:hypothetical protein
VIVGIVGTTGGTTRVTGGRAGDAVDGGIVLASSEDPLQAAPRARTEAATQKSLQAGGRFVD